MRKESEAERARSDERWVKMDKWLFRAMAVLFGLVVLTVVACSMCQGWNGIP